MKCLLCIIPLLCAALISGCDQLANRPGLPCDLLGALCAEEPGPDPDPGSDPCADGGAPVLMAHYPFSGDADDASGNGGHATVVGATLTTDRLGNPEAAYRFDGDDFIRIEDHSRFNGMCSFTLSAWIYPASLAALHSIIAKVNPNRDFHLRVYQETSDETRVSLGMVTPQGPWGIACAGVAVERWSHVVGIWDGSAMRIYLDGDLLPVRSTDRSDGLEPAWTGEVIQIGAMNTTEFFLGKIDDVRIYEGALTDAQIRELYAGE